MSTSSPPKSPEKKKRTPQKSPKKSPKKAARAKKEALLDMDVVVPTALLGEPTGGECSLLVQIDPKDARLDFEGQTGAVGRLESDETGGKREE